MYTILRYLVLVIICLAAYYLGKNYIRQFREAKKMSDDQMEEQRRKKEACRRAYYEQTGAILNKQAGADGEGQTAHSEDREERSGKNREEPSNAAGKEQTDSEEKETSGRA